MSDNYYSSSSDIGVAGTHVTNWVSSIPSTAGNIRYTKVGRLITLHFPVITANSISMSFISAETNLPSNLWPLNTIFNAFIVRSNAVNTMGVISILTDDGSINIFADLQQSNFITALSNGFPGPQTVSYISKN